MTIDELDAEIIERLRDNDPDTWLGLVNSFGPRLFALAKKSMCGYRDNSIDASDFVQETYLKIFLARDRLDPEKNMKAYLFTTCANTVRNAKRKPSSRDVRECDADTFDRAAESATTSARHEEAELRNLRSSLSELSPQYRSVVYLRDILGCSYEEIARTLGISNSAVKSQLHRGREKVRVGVVRRSGSQNTSSDGVTAEHRLPMKPHTNKCDDRKADSSRIAESNRPSRRSRGIRKAERNSTIGTPK